MNEDAIKDAYDLFVNTGYNKSYENFKTLIQSNPNARKDAYDLFVSTGYNKTQKDFDELMGIGAPAPVKKKEQVSPSQQKAQPTSLATGAMGPDGEPVPSAKKGPSLQEQLQSGINLAASAAVASSKPGFTPVPKEEADKALYGKAKVKEGTLGLSGGRTKDVIISSLNEDFGKLGVRFEQPQNPLSRSMGDIVATADNGQSITIQASSDGKAAESESKRLQSFLMGNSAGVEKKEVTPIEMLKMMQGGIAENEQEKFKRVYTPEMINETVKFVNDEVTKANKKLQDISGQIDEINNEAARITGITGTATPESQARMQELTASYDLLKAEFDKERENAQVISKLGVEGINIASAEHLKLLEQKGGFGKSIYNHTVEMLGNTANGILQMATLGILDEGGKYAQETIDQFKKDTKFSDTEVYEQNSNMAMQVLFSMPEWLPMAAMGPAVGTTFMFTQGVGRKVEELNNNPETKDLSQLEKLAIVSPMAYVEARLENLGLSAWLSKNKGIAASIAIKAVANVSPKAGAAGIARLINTEINNLAVKGLLNVTGASLAEAETGALQYVAESGMKELYNIAEQRQIFKQPQFGSEAWAKELAESAIMEGLGGAFVSGPINIAQQTANYAVGKSNTNETFKIVKDLLNDNIAERSMIAQLNSAVNEGKISKEKAQTTLYNFREAKSIVRDIPQDLSEDNQRKAFDLIAEKRKLTKQIEGKDPSLVDKQKTRITAIDQELKNISNAVQEQTTSEVPVQSGAAVSGEVAEGKPKAEPQVVTEEGQAQEEVIPGSKGVISGIEITYPTQEQRAEREAVRNSQDYVSARSIELPVTDTEALAEDLKGEFAMVTGENPDGQPLTEEENQALNQKAEEWLTSRGYDPKPIVGKFNQAENSFFVKGMTEADAIEFAQEFNQKSVAHSGGMLYQNGSRNPRTTGDDFSFGKFEPGMDMVSIVNTTDGPRQFSVAYDFKTTIESDAVSEFDQAVNNSAQSLKLVAPDLKIIVAENTEDAQLQIAEALSAVAPSQAADVAEGFTTETRGQTVFVNGKPFAIVLDKSQADTVTIGHEAWETMLNDAFGDDQVKFKEFRDGIDRQLRLNGFEDIAKALTDFSNQRGYEDVKYSEYMAELGGMLVAGGFKQGSLDAKQKSLLEKIGDVINKFAQLFTGKKQFLDEATPEDILGFMITISNKLAKGEDVSTFFREKNTQEIKDTKKVFSNRSQKIGDFDIQYFEDDAAFQDLVDRKLVVQNASIDEAGGQPVAIHQPDNLLVGNVNYKGKKIMEGNGGIYYVLKFGNVWASGKQNSAKTLANYINKSRKESIDGIGRMVLVRGSQDKMISSVQGVKAAMRILEELVFDNLISTSDFRKALTSAGKAYNIDFSGNNSAKQIQKDIEDKFMNVSDSTFAKRGDFFSTLVNEIGKLESANKNIKEIQKALGATKNIQFSKGGIRQQIGTVLTERLLIGLDSGNAYAIVEVDEDVVVKKDDQHPSYPFSIVTKSGKPPVLKVFNYRPKAVEAITTMSGEKASNAKLGLAQMGMGMGRIASDKEIVVKSRSQKNVPTVVDEVLTDDGKGNYLFVHYSDELRDTIKPMSGSKKNFTSREEVSAISAVGGVAMYYTKQGQVESGVGNVPHTVLVPKDKVYFYGSTEKGTVSHDPEGFEEEARQRFQAYRNRGNEDRPTKYAFDANNSAAWVTKVAAENGYDMLVTNWGGPKSYRAQTTKALKPEAEYTGFKQIPEPTYEVGDEIFLYGRYATVVAVDGNTLSYESPNDFGRFDSGKFTLSPYTSNKIMLIEKAKPTVTTKSQKIVVNTIPGYERFLNQIEGMMDKGIKNGTSYNKITENVIEYIQRDSAVYERADDSQREQIIRDFVKLRGEKFKVAPSVGKILGQIKDVKKVTVNEKTALKDQIKLEAKAAKDAVAFVKQLRMQISGRLKMMAGRGVISAKQASTILARYDRMNILNPDMRDRFVDYMANVFQSAEYADKVKEATKLRKTIRKAAKNPDNQAENSKMAKSFAEIDPSRVENIDDYLNNAEQMLKAVSRKTGDVKMRSLVNMTDMFSYVNKEIQAQREQIKNEILSKYQDLVDAGVLDSKMTINEIQKVVEAIEEKKDESEAKAKEAKEAVKQMMDELSPILLQIARTGEDPFTGDPIDLTQDEKSAIVKLAKMDLDNLSLAEAVKALEYANNFIANGVTSGIVGMVDLYEGSLNTEKLVKKGFKSIPIKKYFSPGAGRIWMEQIASLPMVNKLMWGSTSRALEVSEASGVTGVSNGKAKAIKIVEKAVKEYVATFSKVKDFLSSENVVERGMLAFVSRNVIGDEFQVQAEFNRRKTLIEETIQALKDPENSTDAEIKKGEVVEKVYNKILKDAKNAKEVRANVSEINKKAVDWWVNEWSKHYDRMDEVSRNVYNTLLSRDANFTPDRFQLKEVSPAAEEDFDSGFFGNFENVSTEKSGSLKENKRIKNLPQNKNGVKTRIVNLDFDVNNVNALTNAMVDVETAGSVMQMKGFVTSKDFSKLFASKEDKDMYKRRLVSYVNRAKGQGYVDQSELKTLNRLVNTVASFGTAKALFSLSQPFKQSIPPLFNTLVQTGRLDLGTLMVGGFSFIDRTGYPIANRGISSQGELKSINRQLVEAEKNLLLRGVDGVAAYSNLMLELTLKYPDIMTARSSWLSFYKKGLKKEGIKTSGINWNTHEVNKKAADYAQMMVDSQQNISDSDMQGEFMASKDPAKAFLRRAIFPLMTFVLNQKTRIWADIRTLSNKAVTTTEDRQEAAFSLAGALVELGAFSAISYAANSMLWEVAMNIIAAVSGEDDDDDREEEKKKMILRRSAYTAQNFMKDFFVPPIPGADLLASKGINYILDETNLSSEIPADWFGIEDDRVKFRLYDKENQGYLDMLGTQGIAIEKALELADYYDIAIDGTFKEERYGTKREKQILEGDADMARINAAIMTGYYGGLLPADVAYIVGQINKKIKKRAEVVEEED